MPKFRNKSIVIEAIKYTAESCRDIHKWMELEHAPHNDDCANGIQIETSIGSMIADVGDWIIRCPTGEFWRCDPAVFERTYEPLASSPQPETVVLEGEAKHHAAMDEEWWTIGDETLDGHLQKLAGRPVRLTIQSTQREAKA